MMTILGCGNLNRSDDGVGVVVARRVAEGLTDEERGRVAVFDTGTDGMGVMYRARGATSLIVVDASRTGVEPGAIHVVPGAELEREPATGTGLHDFRWDHALYVGRRIYGDEFPEQTEVFLIEAEDLSIGVDLTATVERSAERVVDLILEKVRDREE